MAHPFIFESTFEQGSNVEWDSESDTGSLLDFPHYSTLAIQSGTPIPYRGAYCMRVALRDTNDHTLTEGDIDIADAATRYFRFYLYASSDVTATADDTFNIFELQQAGGTIEMALSMRITAATNLLEIGFGDGTVAGAFVPYPVRGKWVCVELLATVSTVGAGVATLFLDGAQVQTTTSLTQAAAVGQGVLGTQNTLSTTTGTLYFDDFVMDDARLYPNQRRFPTQWVISKSQHIFVGPGVVDGAALLSTTAGNVLSLYDTDAAEGYELGTLVARVVVGGVTGVSGPLVFLRGCYVEVTGTTPLGAVYLTQSSEKPGIQGPRYYSPGAIRRYAHLRKARVNHV